MVLSLHIMYMSKKCYFLFRRELQLVNKAKS